jgi:hypothetical protein
LDEQHLRTYRVPTWLAFLTGVASALILLASVVVHVLTFVPDCKFPWWVWSLHGAIFPPFFVFMYALTQQMPSAAELKHLNYFERITVSQQLFWRLLRRLHQATPRPLVGVFLLMLVYIFINFGLAFARSLQTGDVPLRGFSGHWMYFALIPFIYFFWTETALQEMPSSSET